MVNKYYFFYYDEYKVLGIEDKKPLLQTILEVNEIIESADVFVYPVNLGSRDTYYKNLVKKTNETCVVVSVPLATFEAYWPQDNKKNYYEKSKYYIDKLFENMRNDINIEQAIEEGDESIMSEIDSIDFYDAESIFKEFERTFRKFEIIERKANIKISDYYRRNYKRFPLYMDRGHISIEVAKEYVRRILNYLNINYDFNELASVDLSWYELCHSEEPIYKCVENAIGLSCKEKYRFVQNNKVEFLSKQEYFEYKCKIIKIGYQYKRSVNNNVLK